MNLTSGAGIVSWDGTSALTTLANPLTPTNGGTGLATLTAHNVMIGEGTSNVAFAAPGATTGVALVSNGAASDPSFTTVSVAGGGTGLTTLTAHNVMLGEGTSNVAFAAPTSTTGIPLVSNGASSDPSFTTASVAGGGTGNTTFTAYSVITAGTTATGAFQNVSGLGTAGQVLTSAGAGALPTWGNGGSLVRISTQTANDVAAIAFTSGLTTYNRLLLTWENVTPKTNAVTLNLQLSTNGGSSYLATGYKSGANQWTYNSATWTNNNQTTAVYLTPGTSTTVGDTAAGHIWISDFNSGAAQKFIGMSMTMASGSPIEFQLSGTIAATSPNALQVLMSSGHINTGTFVLYGVVE